MAFAEHGRGVIASNLIINYLIKLGYEVLTEGTGQGLIDLVIVHPKTGKVLFVDCKCLSRRENGSRVNRVLKPTQKALADLSKVPFILAYADTDTGEVEIPNL